MRQTHAPQPQPLESFFVVLAFFQNVFQCLYFFVEPMFGDGANFVADDQIRIVFFQTFWPDPQLIW